MNIIITKEQLQLIKEAQMLNETQSIVDNFDYAAQILNLTDPDQFYFIQIVKRWKDNKDKGMTKNIGDTYHGGGDFGNYANGTAFKVRTAQDLMAVKPQIVAYCDKNNARAYMTLNPRRESEIAAFKPTYLSRQQHHNHGVMPQYAKYADEILAGQAKEDASWTERPRFQIDIDTKDQRIWNITKAVLAAHNIPIEYEANSPSGGLHIFIADRFSIPDVDAVIDELRVFDAFKDMGRNQTVHLNFDGKLNLYSNVDTAGY